MINGSQSLKDYNKAFKQLTNNLKSFSKDSDSFANEVKKYAETQVKKNKMIDQEWVERLTTRFHTQLAEAVLLHYENNHVSELAKTVKVQK